MSNKFSMQLLYRIRLENLDYSSLSIGWAAHWIIPLRNETFRWGSRFRSWCGFMWSILWVKVIYAKIEENYSSQGNMFAKSRWSDKRSVFRWPCSVAAFLERREYLCNNSNKITAILSAFSFDPLVMLLWFNSSTCKVLGQGKQVE